MMNPSGRQESRRKPLRIPRREGCSKVATNTETNPMQPLGRLEVNYPVIDEIDSSNKIDEVIKNDVPVMPPPTPTPYTEIYDQHWEEIDFYKKLLNIISTNAPISTYDNNLRVLSKPDLCRLCMMLTGIGRCRLETIIEEECCDCLESLPKKLQVAKIWLITDDGEAYDMKQKFHDCFDALSSYVCTRYVVWGEN